MKQIFRLIVLMAFTSVLYAGEPSVPSSHAVSMLAQRNVPLGLRASAEPAGITETTHFTGVPEVDMFSLRNMQAIASQGDSIASFPDMTSEKSPKSPWIAGALSLAVPGAGEIYAGDYLKGAIFFGIEVGAWVTAYIYDKKGDDQTAEYEAYANQHWSAVRYALWTYQHSDMLNHNANPGNYDIFYGVDPDSVESPGAPPFLAINWDELRGFERDIASLEAGDEPNGYTHQLPYYGQQQYYELIGKYEQYYSGWDDVVDFNEKPNRNFIVPENSRFKIYSRMRAEANNQYDVASTMVSIAVINHVLSAIDAAWTASRYNKALHAQVGMRMQRTPYGMVPVKEAKVSWTF